MRLAMGGHSVISVCLGFMVGGTRTRSMNELPKTLSQTARGAEWSLHLNTHHFLLKCCCALWEWRWGP